MKKIYLSFASLLVCSFLSAQEAFWTPTNYKGAFPVTDNTAATDWTSGWSNFDPENNVYPATITTVSADITSSATWSGVVLLQNKVYVKNNATLTILPGTIIRGDKLTQGTLIITRGAKIIANGTSSNPIIFTSGEAVGARNEGDWGGLVLLGLARNNQPGGVANIEGIAPTTDTQFGGNFDDDNSGSLKYVRVEFAGIPLQPNKEINGITFGSVGSGTTVDYCQVSFSGDDSYEWFGGTVNCKHLIAYRGLDDDFDTDFGFRGKIQFGLIIRDQNISDAAGDSNSFESDNDAAGSNAQPLTAAIFSNITTVGAKGDGTLSLPIGEKFEKAFRIRRNSSISVFNTLATGWEKGLSIEGASAEDNVTGDSLSFSNNELVNLPVGSNVVTAASAFYTTFFGADNNDSTKTIAQINWVNLFPSLGTTPDARLGANSTAANGGDFTNLKFYNLAAPTVSSTVTYCEGATASALVANGEVGNTFKWYTQASGGSSVTIAPIPSTNSAGTFQYYVSQNNAAGDESPRTLITVVVNALPATPAITANGPTSFCTGGSVTLSSSATTGNLWSNALETQDINVTASGTYTVTATNNEGCSSTSNAVNVSVSNSPVPTINSTATSACEGETITLTSSVADSYLWSNGAITQTIDVTANGTFTVLTTNADACNGVGTSAPITLTFGAVPAAVASFTTSGTVVTFTNTSSGATTYSWDFGDQTNSSASNPVHAFAGNGSYAVILTATNGNCSDTTLLTVVLSVGIEEMETIGQAVVYPNPAQNEVNVGVYLNESTEVSINIYDITGKLVSEGYKGLMNSGENIVKLNTTDLTSGLYSTVITTSKSTKNMRLILTK
jgi:hypothetical protein